MAAKRCGNFHRPITDALKGRHQRLHHEGHRINHRPDDQPGEAEIKRSQPERLREHPQRTVRTQGNEDVKAQYGWRKYERQRDYRIDCRTPTALAAGQPPGESGSPMSNSTKVVTAASSSESCTGEAIRL